MKQFIIVVFWVAFALAHGKEISRGEDNGDLEKRLMDLTESEDPALGYPGGSCNFYHKVNCYKDKPKHVLGELLLTFRDKHHSAYAGYEIDWHHWQRSMRRMVCDCGKKARAKGYTYFAMQYYGECWSGPTSQNPHNVYDLAYGHNHCVSDYYQPCYADSSYPCVGKEHYNFLYHINEAGSGGGPSTSNPYAYDN